MLRSLRGRAAAALLALPALAGCDTDSTGPRVVTAEAVSIVNSTDRTLTVVATENPNAKFTVGLGAQGSPVSVAARGRWAVVPMGTYPFAVVVDLQAGAVSRTVPLPAGSGATGVAFLNDSIAIVANPALNSVTPVNVLRGTAGASIAVGGYPQAVVAGGGRVYVLNAELVNFSPARTSTVTVIDGALQVAGTIPLGGFNASAGAFESGRLYVVNSGHFGQADGSLSVVDAATLTETHHATGFGSFPGSIALDGSGLAYVGLYDQGLLVWNTGTRTFTRGPDNPLLTGGGVPLSGVGFDGSDRLYTLHPGTCQAAGAVTQTRLSSGESGSVTTGVCPFALAFSSVPASD